MPESVADDWVRRVFTDEINNGRFSAPQHLPPTIRPCRWTPPPTPPAGPSYLCSYQKDAMDRKKNMT